MDDTTIPFRVSCAGLIRIDLEDKILAILNRDKLKKGISIYSPPGGAYYYQGRTTKKFLQDLGFIFEKGRDLRLTGEGSAADRSYRLEEFARWFHLRHGRELKPSRELYEELVREETLLTLQNNGFPRLTHSAVYRFREHISRSGQDGTLTEYFFEVFKAHLTRYSRALIHSGLKRSPSVRLLTVDEIIEGVTDDVVHVQGAYKKVPIASSFSYLL